MNLEKEMDGLLEFLQAIERGKLLHPGLLGNHAWQLALEAEIEEYKSERCSECSECDDRCSSVSQIVRLKNFMGEVTDIAVVAYRYRLFLAELIAEKERTFAG